jgi:DNA-nicking Smr family endonuclease
MAGRRLSPEEAALWKRVASGVRPVAGRIIQNVFPSGKEPRVGFQSERTAFVKSLAPIPPVKRSGLSEHQSSNTLDGGWDRKIGSGQIAPERTIDLHGHNLAGAHHRLDRGLDDAVRGGVRVILLVTGRPPRAGTSRIDLPLRGIIRESVGDWPAASRHAKAIAAVRNAHPRHGGAGALYLILRRPR